MDVAPFRSGPESSLTHVAIIMDGNGRWAQVRGLPRAAGHREGGEAVKRTVRAAAELGISYLTLFGFSSENWKRPTAEVDNLMGLLRVYLSSEIADLHRNGVRVRVIGDRSRLAPDIVAMIENAESLTRGNQIITVTAALSYGSRDEIARASRELAVEVADGKLRAEQIDATAVSRHLFTSDMPDPDLIIRTSGEQRLSNFLLWQSAYSELVFVDTHWPDFSKGDLEDALQEYYRRERRYGAAGG